jgi:hypothetical protein
LELHLGYQQLCLQEVLLNFKSIEAPKPFQWIWRSKVTKKLKIFIWLVFRDRINSRNILKRKNYNIEGDDYNCAISI